MLTNKSYKNYNYLSRYSTVPYFYNVKDKTYHYGLSKNMNKEVDKKIYYVEPNDTLEFLAQKYYGRPDYYGVIADFNGVKDPFINLYETYNYIYLPALSQINFGE